MTASDLRLRPVAGPRSSAVTWLRLCCLTVESSNVFFCFRPVPGPETGAGAGGYATAFQVLSAGLRSCIERPANGRVLFTQRADSRPAPFPVSLQSGRRPPGLCCLGPPPAILRPSPRWSGNGVQGIRVPPARVPACGHCCRASAALSESSSVPDSCPGPPPCLPSVGSRPAEAALPQPDASDFLVLAHDGLSVISPGSESL
jgi:hypothetical protein